MKDEIRRSLAEATPGPWEYAESDNGHEIRMGTAIESTGRFDAHHIIEYNHGCYPDGEKDDPAYRQALEADANARLIANAPTWLQWQNDRIEQLEKALEWSAMIIGSGLDSDAQLQYDPMKWIQTYHSEWKEGE